MFDEAVRAGNFDSVEEARSAMLLYDELNDNNDILNECLLTMQSRMIDKSPEERLAIAQWMLFKMRLVVPCDVWIAMSRKRRKLEKRAQQRAQQMYHDVKNDIYERASPVVQPMYDAGMAVVNTGQDALERGKKIAKEYELHKKLVTGTTAAGYAFDAGKDALIGTGRGLATGLESSGNFLRRHTGRSEAIVLRLLEPHP